jgi:hypothetical protein
MTEEQVSFFEKANELAVNIMFTACSKTAVGLKLGKNKYFYTIFCLEVLPDNGYIIFYKVFKTLKRKNKLGFYFKLEDTSTQMLTTTTEVNNYLNNFLSSFEEHERLIHDFNINTDNLPGGDAIILINEWESSIFNSYNTIIAQNKY